MKKETFGLLFVVVTMAILSDHGAYSSNILVFITDHSRSHCIIQETLMKALASRGHNITVISMCSTKKNNETLPNYHHFHLTEKNVYLQEFRDELKTKIKNSDKQSSKFSDAIHSLKINTQSAHEALDDPETKRLLESGQQFDLFILGWTFNDFLLGLAAHFKCPSIVFHTVATSKSLRDFVASPDAIQNNYASAIAHQQTKLTYLKRIAFFYEHLVEYFLVEFYNYFVLRPYYNQHFPATKNYPSFAEVKRNVSLVFVGHHFSQGAIRPSVPNLIEIGGLQIKDKPNPLPERIEKFLNNATGHGAILFSLGTNVNSADFASEKLSAILTVFGTLKQKIIWKWDGDEMPRNKPANVLMEKWLPQDDILAHPNTRLFISHCGLGGVTEALFHGVPILGIPFIYDQHINAKKVVEEGWAMHLPYDSITVETLSTAINDMLSNQTYANRVKELSLLYRDRPQTALDTAIYWTEYVLRYRGAPHLQFPQAHMNFIQRNSLDVISFFILLIFCIYKLFAFLVRRISPSKIVILIGLFIYVDRLFDFIAIELIVNASKTD